MLKINFYFIIMFMFIQFEFIHVQIVYAQTNANVNAIQNYNVSKNGLALEGYDPVSYFRSEAKKSGPILGNPKLATQKENVTYYFSSEQNLKEFLNNPSKYTPAFGGWCAYAVAETKEKVSVDIKSFLIQDGRLLLFYNGFLADTRKKWQNHKTKSPTVYLNDADKNWLSMIKK